MSIKLIQDDKRHGLFQVEMKQIENGVCMAPLGCSALTEFSCRNCGWNREVHAERVKLLRKNGLTRNGSLRHLDLSEVTT